MTNIEELEYVRNQIEDNNKRIASLLKRLDSLEAKYKEYDDQLDKFTKNSKRNTKDINIVQKSIKQNKEEINKIRKLNEYNTREVGMLNKTLTAIRRIIKI